METCSASKWTIPQVLDWLTSLELPQYRQRFEELSIDGNLLVQITEEDLINDIQISIRLHRFKIIDNLKKLIEEDPSQSSSEDDEWGTMILKSVEGQMKNQVFQVFDSGTSIGRNSGSNDFVINESFVSRKHCEIRLKPETCQYIIKDVGSTTGTFIMITKKSVLHTGDMFQMGLSEFRVVNLRYNPYGVPLVITIVGYEGPARELEFFIDRRGGKIGRDPENEVSVPDDSQLSARHGQIFFENGKFFIEDLESTNKTWKRISAEGESSDEVPVYVGDFIKIGSTVLQVMIADEPVIDESEIEQGQDSADCKLCKEDEPNTMCYPCGHLFCFNCLKKWNKCPTCKKVINDKVKVFK